MSVKLKDYQDDARNKLKNGSILCGGVGSGKSLTAIAYYFTNVCEGSIKPDGGISPMRKPIDLYIITTAKKRDSLEWNQDLSKFLLSTHEESNPYNTKVVVDSWNNIKKYKEIKNAFFILDEQRVVGKGEWVKSFLKIAKTNQWILLSATPGDTWEDYIPVFVANGFYKNFTEFRTEHIVYDRFSKFPKVDRYLNTGRLIRLRNNILIEMNYKRKTVLHHNDIFVEYDFLKYKSVYKERWNISKECPIKNASERCYELRKIVNSDESRKEAILNIFKNKRKLIIFYNFDYELEILKNIFMPGTIDGEHFTLAEWNGHKHQPVPDTESWVYLVQYNAGNEGWNCIKTDTIIFYSQNYSYKVMTQAAGRIDRLNTPYIDLQYYHLKSRSGIDVAIDRALKNKKKFNEQRFVTAT